MAGIVRPSEVVKLPFYNFLTSTHSDGQCWASECPDVENCKWRLRRSGTGCFTESLGAQM